MDKHTIFAVMNNKEYTDKVNKRLALGETKFELAAFLDMSRTTLDKRLECHDWRKGEKALLDKWFK